jgi:predicted NAD-dependent protein-ADP-ribosyltransferase YbiA (DUF1768 family)
MARNLGILFHSSSTTLKRFPLVLDIGAKHGYPSAALSNFAAHSFTFDDIECKSMEGFLQSLKFDKPHIQAEVCRLVGVGAKNRGKDRNRNWKMANALWWKGTEFPRQSDEYQQLLDHAYLALEQQCSEFRKALLDTGTATLTHTIGRRSAMDTILTQREFCDRLESLRAHMVAGHNLATVTRL